MERGTGSVEHDDTGLVVFLVRVGATPGEANPDDPVDGHGAVLQRDLVRRDGAPVPRLPRDGVTGGDRSEVVLKVNLGPVGTHHVQRSGQPQRQRFAGNRHGPIMRPSAVDVEAQLTQLTPASPRTHGAELGALVDSRAAMPPADYFTDLLLTFRVAA